MTTETRIAYHGDATIKAKYLARVREHRRLDHLVQGQGWHGGKGCAVGCTLEDYDHKRYPIELGIPIHIAHLEDSVFEGLGRDDAMAWPEDFLDAIEPGTDLSMVWPRFALWLLSDASSPMRGSAQHESVQGVINGVATLYAEWVETGSQPADARWGSAASAARSAAWDASAAIAASAASAARSAAWDAIAARSAASAAIAAIAAIAASAANAARDASAARSAASAAIAANAASAARDAWITMRDKLLELLRAAPVVEVTQ